MKWIHQEKYAQFYSVVRLYHKVNTLHKALIPEGSWYHFLMLLLPCWSYQWVQSKWPFRTVRLEFIHLSKYHIFLKLRIIIVMMLFELHLLDSPPLTYIPPPPLHKTRWCPCGTVTPLAIQRTHYVSTWCQWFRLISLQILSLTITWIIKISINCCCY